MRRIIQNPPGDRSVPEIRLSSNVPSLPRHFFFLADFREQYKVSLT